MIGIPLNNQDSTLVILLSAKSLKILIIFNNSYMQLHISYTTREGNIMVIESSKNVITY